MASRKSDPEPVTVTIHMPWRGAGGYKTAEIRIRIDKPDWRFIVVEMAFDEFWKAVLKLAARPGKMTQWVRKGLARHGPEPDSEPVEVTLYVPSSGADDYRTVEIQIDKPGHRYVVVEMAFGDFWNAVCSKAVGWPGKMTQWVEPDDG